MGKRRIKTHFYTGPIMDSKLLINKDFNQAIEKACTSKETYYSYKQANEQALYLRAYLNLKGIYPYKCHYCENWHIGHRQ